MSDSPAGPNYAAINSMQQHDNNNHPHASNLPHTEGGEMTGPKYGGQVDFGAVSGSIATPGSGADMSEMFAEINHNAAFHTDIQDALNTLGPTTTEGLKYANDYHNANLGQNVGANNIALPGATEAKGAIGVPRGNG